MARIALETKIENAQVKVDKYKEKYDAALKELNALKKKQAESKKKEILAALESSERSEEEILAFLNQQ